MPTEDVTRFLNELGRADDADRPAGAADDPAGSDAPPSPAKQRASDQLLDAVYTELRDLAEKKLRHERREHTLQPTALVHEAYLRLVDQSRVDWQGRAHFYAVAAEAMRRVLIDYARFKKREKRGGKWRRVPLDDAYALQTDRQLELMALDEALEKMRTLDERQTRVVSLRLFGGMTSEEVARLLDCSARTVERDWKMGLAWLRRELSKGESE